MGFGIENHEITVCINMKKEVYMSIAHSRQWSSGGWLRQIISSSKSRGVKGSIEWHKASWTVRIVVGKCRGMDERKGYTIHREWNRNLQQTNTKTTISCIKGHDTKIKSCIVQTTYMKFVLVVVVVDDHVE